MSHKGNVDSLYEDVYILSIAIQEKRKLCDGNDIITNTLSQESKAIAIDQAEDEEIMDLFEKLMKGISEIFKSKNDIKNELKELKMNKQNVDAKMMELQEQIYQQNEENETMHQNI